MRNPHDRFPAVYKLGEHNSYPIARRTESVVSQLQSRLYQRRPDPLRCQSSRTATPFSPTYRRRGRVKSILVYSLRPGTGGLGSTNAG